MTTGTTAGICWKRLRAMQAAMEPRRDDGDDQGGAHQLARVHVAAMEPRRDDGDDEVAAAACRLACNLPQWSPVVTTGTTPPWGFWPLDLVLPQWSPVVTTGTTTISAVAAISASTPQWSPVVTTGTTTCSWTPRSRRRGAAMEPRRDDGDDPLRAHREAPAYHCRNGAPS